MVRRKVLITLILAILTVSVFLYVFFAVQSCFPART